MRAEVAGSRAPPQIQFRNRTFLALVMTPEFPIADWFAALDRQLGSARGFFRERPVVVDLSGIRSAGPGAAPIVLDGLEARELRLVGVEGVEPAALAATPWAHLAKALPGRDVATQPQAFAGTRPDRPGALLIERPVRSGQSIVFEDGDVTIVGAVASGAEVIAGGSIHVYGALRGRAIAGLRIGADARIFCRRLEAELVGVDRLYRTAEHWGRDVHGRPAQVLCDRGALRISAVD